MPKHRISWLVPIVVVLIAVVAVVAVIETPDASAMNLKPLGDRVVLQPYEDDVRAPAVVPAGSPHDPALGRVLAVGPGEWHDGERIPMDVQVGDHVYYLPRDGLGVDIEGNSYVIIAAKDVLAVLA